MQGRCFGEDLFAKKVEIANIDFFIIKATKVSEFRNKA